MKFFTKNRFLLIGLIFLGLQLNFRGLAQTSSAPPAITAGSSTAICIERNESVILTAAAAAATDLNYSAFSIGTVGKDQWQSFAPTKSADIVAITITTNGCPSTSGTFTLYSGVGTAGIVLNTQNVTVTGCNVSFVVNLPNIGLTAGSNYTFRFQTSNDLYLLANNNAPGSYYSNSYGLNPGWKLCFTTTMISPLGAIQWFNNTSLIGGATANTYTATNTGAYTATSTVAGNSSSPSNSISVTAKPLNTVTLTSAPATTSQTLLVNTPLTNITYSTTNATGATFSGLPAGVTGIWSGNTVTISGTPTATGTFNYTVTLTGGCGTITATGTITVFTCTITLTSASGSNSQTVCNNTAITNITYSTTGATGASFTGLPAGVSGSWAANVATISGTATASGSFTYTVTLTGGGCGAISATGSIIVNPTPTIICPANITTNVSAPVLIANYPLITNLADATGTFSAVFLQGNQTAPTAPTTGNPLCQNGIYLYSNNGTNGQNIQTPIFGSLNTTDFTIQIDFRLAAYGNGAPVIMGGNSFRWIGIYVNAGGNAGVKWNNSSTAFSTKHLTVGQWYTSKLAFSSNTIKLYIDGALVLTTSTGGPLNTGNNTNFLTTDFSTAQTLNGCIRNLQISNGTAKCSAIVNYTAPVGTGNCASVTTVQTSGLPSGAAFPVGITTNTFVTTDGAGNTANCSFNVTVVDNILPTITCPADVFTTANNDGSCTATNVVLGSPSVDDNCSVTTTAKYAGNTVTAATVFPLGNSTVVWTATDASGNTATCNQTVTVNSLITNVNQPSSQTVCAGATTTLVTFSSTPAVIGTVYNWTNNTTSIGLAASGTGNIASFNAINTTALPITATVVVTPITNCAGSAGVSKTFTITVNPTPNAVATPSSQTICSASAITTIALTGNITGTVYNWSRDNAGVTGIGATGSGNISGSLTNTTSAAVTVTFTITPSYTNGGTTCTGTPITATVIVNPTPDVAQPANQVVCNNAPTTAENFTGSVTGTAYNWINNTTSIGLVASGSGNIGSFTAINSTNAPITATVTVTPQSGGSTATFNYTGTMQTWTVPVGVASVNLNAVGAQGGSVSVSCTANGGLGAMMKGDFAVTPGEVLNIMIGQQGRTNNEDGGGGGGTFIVRGTSTALLVAGGGGGASNNVRSGCGPTSPGVNASITTSGTASGNGQVAGGNAGNGGGAGSGSGGGGGGFLTDGTAGTGNASSKGKSYLNGGAGGYSTVSSSGGYGGGGSSWSTGGNGGGGGGYSGGATSNAYPYSGGGGGGSYNAGTNQVNTAGVQTGNGQLIITYYTSSACTGSAKTFTYTVNPTPTVNVVSNQVACNSAQTTAVSLSGAVAGTVYNWINNTTSIGLAASGTGDIAAFTATNATGSAVTATITVTPTYTNAGSTCTGTPTTFTIMVNAAPTITCPANITVNNTTGQCGANVTYPSAIATGSPTPNITYSQASGSYFSVGSTVVTATATNSCGTVSCTFTVTVVDNQAPTIVCPADISVNATSASGAVVTYTAPVGTDNCVSTTVRTAGLASGSTFPIGTTTVTHQVTDASGLTTECSFTVTVTGILPQIVCPSNITENNTTGQCGANVNFAATETVGIPASTITYSQNPGTFFPVGTTTVTATATNSVGSSTCTFTVTVVDNTAPVISCPTNITVNNTAGQCGAVVNYGPSNNITFSQDFLNGPTNATYCEAWTSFRNQLISGNTYNKLTIKGTFDPVGVSITDPTVIDQIATALRLGANGTWNSGGRTWTVGDCGGAGALSASSGGVCSCGSGYTVRPCINFPGNSNPNWGGANTETCNSPSQTLTVVFQLTGGSGSGIVATDNCSGVTITQTAGLASGSSFPIGTTTNTFVATDASGNTATCNFTVTVVDNQAPTIVCPSNITMCGSQVVDYTMPTATDNCSASIVQTAGLPSGSIFPVGTTVNTFTATDPSGNSANCSFNVTINPIPTVNTVSNQSVCNGNTATQTFTGAVTGTVYNWTNSNTAIGLAASGSGDISFTATNVTAAPVTATITVTPSYTNGGTTCTGTPKTFTITVNPTPAATISYTGSPYCQNAGTATVTRTGTVGGTYSSTTGLSINATTGDVTLGTSTSGTYTVTYTIAESGGCAAVTTTTTITITTLPAATISYTGSPYCQNAGTASVTRTGTAGGTYSSTVGLMINATTGTVTLATSTAGTYTVTYTLAASGGCAAVTTTTAITVNPTPDVAQPTNQVVCNNTATTAINFTGSVTGTNYTWTNNTTSIGLAASGTGNIASFTATNTTTAPVTATITVTPSYTNAGVTCVGTPRTFTITVNPTATVNPVANQVLCNNFPTTAVTFTSPTTGGTIVYNWANNTTSIGLAASGTGNIASFTATNTTTAPVTATITVTPSYTNAGVTCVGTPRTFTITVNPTATVIPVANQVLCNGSPTTAVTFTSPTTGGTIVYNWANNTTSIGLAASGTGNIASFTAANTTTAPVTATITVTPSYTNAGVTCVGTPTTYTYTVNPTATVNVVANQVICNLSPTTAVTFTSPTTGGTIVYNWTNTTTSIGLAASGTGNIASFTATNTTTAPVTATITVTPSYTNAGVTCVGTPRTFTITVNPTATVNPVANQVLCNNFPTTAVTFTSPTTGGTIVYNWTNNTTSIGLAATGTGNIASFTATNTTQVPVVATITVTPSYTNAGVTCMGTPITYTYTVNPTPIVTLAPFAAICKNAAPITLTGGSPVAGAGTTGVYLVDNVAQTIFNPANYTPGLYTIVYVYTNVFGCVNSATQTILVLPIHTVEITVAPNRAVSPNSPLTVVATVSPVDNYTYVWRKNGTVVSGANGDRITVLANDAGNYTVTVTAPTGCVVVSSSAFTPSASVPQTLFIFPNPNTGVFNVAYNNGGANLNARTLNVYDTKGQRVFSQNYSVNVPFGNMKVDIRKYAKGLYYVVLNDSTGKKLASAAVEKL